MVEADCGKGGFTGVFVGRLAPGAYDWSRVDAVCKFGRLCSADGFANWDNDEAGGTRDGYNGGNKAGLEVNGNFDCLVSDIYGI